LAQGLAGQEISRLPQFLLVVGLVDLLETVLLESLLRDRMLVLLPEQVVQYFLGGDA
jgi:hypothetical protein